jgi:hypothetical protein
MFIDANQQVEEVWYTLSPAGWHIQNLTNWPGRVPAAGKALNTFMGPDGAHTFYVGTNGHLDQIWWTGSQWLWQDLSLGGAAPDSATGIASYSLDNATPEIFFLIQASTCSNGKSVRQSRT